VFACSHHPQPLTEQGRPLRVQPSNPGLVLFSLCPSPSTLSPSLCLSHTLSLSLSPSPLTLHRAHTRHAISTLFPYTSTPTKPLHNDWHPQQRSQEKAG
jgi:hypothetical protein